MITSAGEVLGTGGDPRHDVIDRARHRRARRRATTADGAREPARAPARRPRRRGARPGRARHAARARRARGHRRGRRCSPSRPSLAPHASVRRGRRVDRAVRDRVERGVSHRASRRPARHHAMAPARPLRSAVRARGAERGRRAVARRASSTPAGSSLPVLGAALLPHALGALVRRRGWSVWVGVRPRRSSALVVYVRARARAVDHHLRAPGRRHLARARPPALRRVAPAAHRAGARRRPPTAPSCSRCSRCGAWPRSPTGSRSDARRDARRDRRPRSCSSCGRRRSAPTTRSVAAHRRLLRRRRRVPPRAEPRVLDRRRQLAGVAARGARPHWLAPAALLGGAAMLVALVRRAARARAPAPTRSSTSPTPAATARGGHSYQPSLAPFVDIGAKLGDVDDRELFTVQSRTPDYWRIAALDEYTRRRRRPVDAERGGRRQRAGRAAERRRPTARCEQEFAIGPLGERWLPAAYRPVAITLRRHARGARRRAPRRRRRRASAACDYTVVSEPAAARRHRVSPRSRSRPRRRRCPTALRRVHRAPRTPTTSTTIAAHARAGRRRRRRDHPVREGGGAARLLPRRHGFVYDTDVDSLDNGRRSSQFLHEQARVLRAVRERVRGDGALARHPGARRGRASRPAREADGTLPRRPATTRTRGPRSTSPGSAGRTCSTPRRSDQADARAGRQRAPQRRRRRRRRPTPRAAADRVHGAAPPGARRRGGTGTPGDAGTDAGHADAWRRRPRARRRATRRRGSPVLVVARAAGRSLRRLATSARCSGSSAVAATRRRDADDPAVAVSGRVGRGARPAARGRRRPRVPRRPRSSSPRTVPAGTGSPRRRVRCATSRARTARRATATRVTAPDDARDAWASVDELERALDDGVSWTRRWRRRLDPSTARRAADAGVAGAISRRGWGGRRRRAARRRTRARSASKSRTSASTSSAKRSTATNSASCPCGARRGSGRRRDRRTPSRRRSPAAGR